MTSTLIKSFRFCCSKLVMALCGLGLCCPCLADLFSNDQGLHSGQSPFQFSQQDMRLEFTPVSLMDDEALIASANMRRDASMNNDLRLLNSQWLMQNERNTWSGGRAVGKILKTSFKQFIASRYQVQSNLIEQPGEEQGFSLWQNYSVSLSADKVMLGLRYQF